MSKSKTVQVRVHRDLKLELKKLASNDEDCSIVMASKKAAKMLRENNHKFGKGGIWSPRF